MKTLSIDTSSNICSLAILDDNKIIYEDYIADKLTHSENLMPMIKKAFDNLQINLADIDLFACSKAIGISSLEGLAYNIVPKENSLVCSIIDAKNNNVYAGLFKYEDSHYSLIDKYISDNINNALDSLNYYSNNKIIFVGSGATTYSSQIKDSIKNCLITEGNSNNSSASGVAKAAIYKYFNCTDKEDLALSPLYLKKSSAEIELEKKLNKG